MRMAAVTMCAMGIVLLTGCDQLSGMLGDEPASPTRRTSVASQRTTRTTLAARRAPPRDSSRVPGGAIAAPQENDSALQLIGLDENDVRAMFGPPSAAEENGPGKTWHYRNGRCSLNLSFYPDVQTRVYRTLAYEVTSDDNSAERKRICYSQFQSVARSR